MRIYNEKIINWKTNTTLFLAGQTVSMFGTMLVQYAIMWHIVLETQSGSMMTVYIIAGVFPTFFTSLFGGVWADKYNKKHIINIADGSIAIVSLAIALSMLAGIDSMILLLIAAAIRALGQGVQQPAVNSLIPVIVPEVHLMRINGFNSSIQSGIFILSPIVSGSLMMLAPLEIIFFIDVITASIGISILYFFVKVPNQGNYIAKKADSSSHFKDLMDGLRYIKKEKYLFQLIILSTIFMIAMSPISFISPLQVTRDFGAEIWRLTAIEIVFSVGMMVGGLVVGIWSFKNRIYSMGIASSVFGLMVVLLGLWELFVPYLISMAICGLAAPYYHTPLITLLQEKVSTEYMGRVLSVFTMLGSIVMPAGMLFFGPLADIIPIDYIFIATGIVMFILSLLFFCNPTLKRAGIKVG